ncbi:hypothetical protein COX99_03170 [Candidatus Pacearchaeota archaeon CG_4_10_14_0_2_um_filter_31_10]|nr:MAG: hypothetical protein COU55_02405 [Candidatus Pacearchaeota archaeon CG10_big_fil_rev_8_21_14_0_10_31_59]PIZ80039.1 MAG: hypothetical protein COX99_03170 [Candidatus Pacearchaeota archaeon CG_4_10_14_0_2_um_filter_31_10]
MIKGGRNIFIIALIITIVLFSLGFLLGNYIAGSMIKKFQTEEEKLFFSLIALDVKQEMVENVCEIKDYDLWKEKEELGTMLTDLEQKLGKDNEEVLAKKELYEIVEIKTLLLLNKMKSECNKDFNMILFFYTNEKNVNGQQSESEGHVLDTIVHEYNEEKDDKRVYIFTFSMETKNSASLALKTKYNITEFPSLVVNENLLIGFQQRDVILDFIKE